MSLLSKIGLFMLVFSLILTSCKKEAVDNDRLLVIDFVNNLKQEKVSFDTILSNFFLNPQPNKHTFALSSLQNELKKSSHFEVISYRLALKQNKNLYKINQKTNIDDVFIILVKKNEDLNQVYCLVKNNKLESISIIRKGNIIIGWL